MVTRNGQTAQLQLQQMTVLSPFVVHILVLRQRLLLHPIAVDEEYGAGQKPIYKKRSRQVAAAPKVKSPKQKKMSVKRPKTASVPTGNSVIDSCLPVTITDFESLRSRAVHHPDEETARERWCSTVS